MPYHCDARRNPSINQDCQGFIAGLRLPAKAWFVLEREDIGTIDQLQAVADRLQGLDGIGPKIARAIRAELARVASLDRGKDDQGSRAHTMSP